ncbi:MAG TPA: flagellar hook-length control protein FliK, partial [Ignavibacteria bacterium]|nr:flagellar hook-length control protein FliK [Ignavibacteria bacterium]
LNEISRLFEKGESKSVVLKLKPDTLGQVKILLDVVDKFVNVNIQVNNESVKQMVQNNINTLVQTLNLSGLHLSSLNVSINNYENKENKSDSEKKKSSTSRFQQKISEDVNTINTKSMGYNTYDFLI